MAIGKRHAGLHARIRNAFVLASEDVGSRVLSGAGFTFLVTALRTLLTIGSTAILARLLIIEQQKQNQPEGEKNAVEHIQLPILQQ